MPKKRTASWRRHAPRTKVTSAIIDQNSAALFAKHSMGYELVAQSEKLADDMDVDLDVEVSGLCKLPARRLQEVMTETDIEQNPVAALHKSMWDFLMGPQSSDSLLVESLGEVPVPTSSSAVSCFEDNFPVTGGDMGDNLPVAIPVWKHGIAIESPASARLYNAVAPVLALCVTDSLEAAALCNDMASIGGQCNAQHVVKYGTRTFPGRCIAEKEGQRSMPEAPCQRETGTIAPRAQFPRRLLTDGHAPLVDPTLRCLTVSALQPPGPTKQCDASSLDGVECETREVPTKQLVSEVMGHDVWQVVIVVPGDADWNVEAQDHENFVQQPQRSRKYYRAFVKRPEAISL